MKNHAFPPIPEDMEPVGYSFRSGCPHSHQIKIEANQPMKHHNKRLGTLHFTLETSPDFNRETDARALFEQFAQEWERAFVYLSVFLKEP